MASAARQDTGRQDTGRQDTARQDTARQDTARQDTARQRCRAAEMPRREGCWRCVFREPGRGSLQQITDDPADHTAFDRLASALGVT